MVTPISASSTLPPVSFADRALDVVNPLQHLPFIGHLYRSLTGDTITPDAQFAGGFLYGGPLGALGAAASMIIGGALDGGTDVVTSFSSKSYTEQPKAAMLDPWKFNA